MKRVGQALVLLIIAAVPAYAGGTPVPVSATPEPATLGLVATGITFVGAITVWRNRKR